MKGYGYLKGKQEVINHSLGVESGLRAIQSTKIRLTETIYRYLQKFKSFLTDLSCETNFN